MLYNKTSEKKVIMNVYKSLNQMIDYIESHLMEKIDYQVLAKFLGVNVYTMERFFSLLVNITITEYIRNRRLSMSFYDLYYGKEKMIDVALKYGYENPTSFSRAFQKFHGMKPSEVKKGNVHVKNYPKFQFNDEVKMGKNLKYRICFMDELTLYGKGQMYRRNNWKSCSPILQRNASEISFKRIWNGLL